MAGHWLKEKLKGKPNDLLARCPLWLAQNAIKPVLPIGWKKYALWQYTDGQAGPEPHQVIGIGRCDRNQYNGTITQLRRHWPFT
jgi:lysozyme